MTEIILNFNKKDFEDIFFRDGNEKIFFSPSTKEGTKLSLIFGSICLILLIFGIFTDKLWFLFFFVLLAFIIQSIRSITEISKILKWRKGVKKYLENTSKYQSNKLVITEQTFSILQDKNETIELWSNFKRVEMREDVIFLYGQEQFIFPKKSMKLDDYEMFVTMVRKKIGCADLETS
jgi:hypothetical protein